MDLPGDVFPAYDDLPQARGLPARLAWDAFGADDRIGTLHHLTPDRVRSAASLVRKGAVFSLNWDLELPEPPLFGRQRLRHTTVGFPHGTDDFYDSFYPQASSQWDALSHVGHPELGYFGGRSASDVQNAATNPLGIEHWARRGIAGRFVLIDVARARARAGRPLDLTEPIAITVDDLERTLEHQGVALVGGDILLVRFGWTTWYRSADQTSRAAAADFARASTPGLAKGEDMARWLWDHRVAAIAGDNPGLESLPADPSDIENYLHFRLLTFLGLAIGELLDLEGLGEDCASDAVYEGFFTAAPLNKRGGSGSTANALAVK